MTDFVPCQGKNDCRYNGTQCLTCGRSFEEIHQLRSLLSQLTAMAIHYEYKNLDNFTDYIASKVNKSVIYLQNQLEENEK